MIVIVFGLPGSGKTYFASKLALRIGGLHISSDAIRQQQQKRKYHEEDKMEIYHAMLVLMEKAGPDKNVVLDATFYKERIRNMFKDKARSLGINIYFIEMKADELVIKERVSRKRPETEADFTVYFIIKSQFEPLKEEHLILNSDQEDLNIMLDKAEEYIEYRNGPSTD